MPGRGLCRAGLDSDLQSVGWSRFTRHSLLDVFLTSCCGRRTLMNLFFKEPQTVLRMREGPLGQYIDSYAAEIRAEGYAHGSAVLQIRLVAAFSRWMVKHRIKAQEITAAQVERYVRSRARDRCPGRSDHAALKRLLNLLLRQGGIPE